MMGIKTHGTAMNHLFIYNALFEWVANINLSDAVKAYGNANF